MLSLSRVLIVLALACVAIATNSQQLHPLHRSKWYKPGCKTPAWYHGRRHHRGKGCYWGDKDCFVNGTHPVVDVDLQDDEQMLWSSPNATDVPVISVFITPYPGQRIIDMGRFSGGVARASCSPNSMTIIFTRRSTFDLARRAWSWVNQERRRSFVLVGDPALCNSGQDREPWLVVGTMADASTLTINLEATKKEWRQVTYKYEIDFGAVGTDPLSRKRFVIPWDDSFETPLDVPFPSGLPPLHVGDDSNHVDLELNCNDCGLSGRLLFEGHLRGGVFPFFLEQCEITLKPVGVRAVVNLELLLGGTYENGMYDGIPDLGADFELPSIPLPSSWHIKGIIELGPEVQLQAGFRLESLQGSARLTTGMALEIPDDSVTSLDLTHLPPSDGKLVHTEGWKPTFEVQPPKLDAELTAVLNLYFQASPSFDVVAFNQRGVTAGFPFRFLDLTLTIDSGSDPNGFCPPDATPYGLKIDPVFNFEISAEVVQRTSSAKIDPFSATENKKIQLFDPEETKQLTGQQPSKVLHFPKKYKPVVKKTAAARRWSPPPQRHDDHHHHGGLGRRDTKLFDEPVLSATDIFPLEPWCIPLGAGGCPYSPDPEDQGWFDAEIAGADDDDDEPIERRHLTILPRALRTLKMTCGEKVDVKLKNYPGPSKLAKRDPAVLGVTVPIMVPGIPCRERNCPASTWNVSPGIQNAVNSPTHGRWTTEHIYEANWLIKFWEHLGENLLSGRCDELEKVLNIGIVDKYADQMLSNIGTTKTVETMMALYPMRENARKHHIFALKNAEKAFYSSPDFTVDDGVCSVGRVVSVCQYMAHPAIQERLGNTVRALDKILRDMDKPESNIPKPPGGYAAAHKDWFTAFYRDGIRWARCELVRFATRMKPEIQNLVGTKNVEYKRILDISQLDPDTDAGWAEICPNTFDYDMAVRANSPDDCGNKQSDPKNCGECGKECKSNETCRSGDCVPNTTPPPPADDDFPPVVKPATSYFTDWELYFEEAGGFSANSYNPPTDWFVPAAEEAGAGGDLTENTRCITVVESSTFMTLGTLVVDVIPAGRSFLWMDNIESETEDSCCIAFFPGTKCSLQEQRAVFCAGSGQTTFAAGSFMVYNCTSLLGPRVSISG